MPRRCRNWCVWALMAMPWVALPAHAAQVLRVRVAREGERFLIDMRIRIAAPPHAVFRALQDYPAMPSYNPDLRAVRVVPTAVPGRVRLFTTVHTCVLIFCRTLQQEEIMTATTDAQGGTLQARLVAQGGSFKAGRGFWTVGICPLAPAASCLQVRIELLPAFWIPPVIGPWVLRAKMEEEARRTSAGLEDIARRRPR
jgi:Polyketide cyclase / dehydrase and lipid transport